MSVEQDLRDLLRRWRDLPEAPTPGAMSEIETYRRLAAWNASHTALVEATDITLAEPIGADARRVTVLEELVENTCEVCIAQCPHQPRDPLEEIPAKGPADLIKQVLASLTPEQCIRLATPLSEQQKEILQEILHQQLLSQELLKALLGWLGEP